MDLQLHNRVAVVTGASRGIGRAIALTLAAEGMRLLLVARHGPDLQAVADACGPQARCLAVDLSQPEAAEQVVAQTIAEFGALHVLVNNAGATVRGDFLELTEAQWQAGFALKFFGAMRCCRAAWPWLQQSQGCIVNVVGVGGRTGHDEFAIGGAVNAALLNLTKVLADRGQREGVRVNAVNPGLIATQRLQARIATLAAAHGGDAQAAAQALAAQMQLSRFGQPEEVAAVVAFLASARASYCQGSVIDVDGGLTRTL